MQISDEGLRLIKSFEGYHTRLKDGSCAAYLCPASVPTIGYGCTEDVKLGMVWTEAEAEAGLRREVAKFESAVSRLVTVDLNQNEYDALVSLAYNIGAGALARSTVLRRLNKGDRLGAAKAFEMWTRGGGRVLPGLVSRRKREAALFLKPAVAPEAPAMPQAVSECREVSKPTIAIGAASVATAVPPIAQLVAMPPAVPAQVTDSLNNVSAWQSVGTTIWTFKDWAVGQPLLAACVVAGMATFYMWSKKQEAK